MCKTKICRWCGNKIQNEPVVKHKGNNFHYKCWVFGEYEKERLRFQFEKEGIENDN